MIIETTAKQNDLIAACFSGKYKIVLYGGAVKGAKTYGMFIVSLLAQKKYPGIRMAFVRKDIPTIERNSYPTWNKIHPSNVLKDKRTDNVNPHIEFKNGSQLIFFGENYNSDKELNRWRGLDVNWFLIDEVNELAEASFYKAIERSGSYVFEKGGTPPPLIVCTCNPSQNWVKSLIYDKYIKNELPKGWIYIPAKITDNPYLSQDYIDGLKLLPSYQYEVFVNGNWDIQIKTGGEFYKCFDFGKQVTNLKYNKDIPLHTTFDFNVNPYVTLIVWQIEGKRAMKINEILLQSPRNKTEEACREFIKQYPQHTAGLFIYGDPSGVHEDTRSEKGFNDFVIIQKTLKQFKPQLRVQSKAPAVASRGNFINTIFEKGFEGIEILMNETCKESIKEYTNLKEASDGTKHKEKAKNAAGVSYEVYGHISDADDYFICTAFANEYAKYLKVHSDFNIKMGKSFVKHRV